jgi:hypothetical protein
MNKQTMELALEALNDLYTSFVDCVEGGAEDEAFVHAAEAIVALKEAIKAQSDNAEWCDDCHGYTHKEGNPCSIKPQGEQEVQYEIQSLADNFRITHIATDSRVATCYARENAERVCNALNHTPAPAIPEGWQIVPIEPTPELMQQLRWEAKRAAAPKGENE